MTVHPQHNGRARARRGRCLPAAGRCGCGEPTLPGRSRCEICLGYDVTLAVARIMLARLKPERRR